MPNASNAAERALAESPTHCPARTRMYRNGVLEREGFSPTEISETLEEPDTIVWLDLLDPETDDLNLAIEELGIHPLAIEDAVHDRQRPKLDRYGTHSFLNVYASWLDEGTGELETAEVSAFVLNRALVTIRKDDRYSLANLLQRWDDNADLAKFGVGFLVHGLLDDVLDRHLHVISELDDDIEELEDDLFADRPQSREVQRRSYELRKSLIDLRRVAGPMEEVVEALMRPELHLVDPGLRPYYQDVHDHARRAAESIDSLRELVNSIFDTNLNLQSNRMNEVMKQLTAWAAIIAVPTAVTGFYGQNVRYPGFDTHWGFWVSSAIMLAIAGTLYASFRKRDWL